MTARQLEKVKVGYLVWCFLVCLGAVLLLSQGSGNDDVPEVQDVGWPGVGS